MYNVQTQQGFILCISVVNYSGDRGLPLTGISTTMVKLEINIKQERSCILFYQKSELSELNCGKDFC